MIDFLLLVFLIILMISLYGLLVSYRSRARGDRPVYYTAENTGDDQTEDENS
ncbi:MAG: hypothetical protein JSU82_10325 [Rhodospirillales bacterium]|nr:MAG: hypothetical protein JSU82_10325 [Rhodospirillales bacterium]